jgi:hypothetical protein
MSEHDQLEKHLGKHVRVVDQIVEALLDTDEQSDAAEREAFDEAHRPTMEFRGFGYYPNLDEYWKETSRADEELYLKLLPGWKQDAWEANEHEYLQPLWQQAVEAAKEEGCEPDPDTGWEYIIDEEYDDLYDHALREFDKDWDVGGWDSLINDRATLEVRPEAIKSMPLDWVPAILDSGSVADRIAVASRRDLTPKMQERLVDDADIEVCQALYANPYVDGPYRAFAVFKAG